MPTIATCDDVRGPCPSGDLSIVGLVVNGPVTNIGDYSSQFFRGGTVAFDVPGEEPLMARLLDASLTEWTEEIFFGFAEVSSPIWLDRLGGSYLGINISVAGSLQFSDVGLRPFQTTSDLEASLMIDEPVHTPEPGTFAPVVALLAASACWFRKRKS